MNKSKKNLSFKYSIKITIFTLGLLSYAALTTLAQTANRDTVIINSFESVIKLTGVSSADVEEKIVSDFGENIFPYSSRIIPLKRQKAGVEYSLNISQVTTIDESGKNYEMDTHPDRTNQQYQIIRMWKENEPVTGTQTHIIRYHVEGAVKYFSDYANNTNFGAFFWEIASSHLPPIQNLNIKIILPQSYPVDSIGTACSKGSPGTMIRCSGDINILSSDESGLVDTVKFTDSLKAGERFITYVTFPKHLTRESAVSVFIKNGFTILMVMVAIAFGMLLYLKFVRKNKTLPET